VRPVIVLADYVLIFLKSPHFVESGTAKMTGTAGQKRVSTEYFAYSPFPLPPLAEQHRIVAKVDELLALCDRLEAARGERDKRLDHLTAASHYHLNNDAGAEAARKYASFYVNHLPTITTRPKQIPTLREAILNLAVRGRIIPQDENDEPVSKLLERIHAEQQRLITAGAIPKLKVRPSNVRTELAFEPPKTWESVTFGQLCNIVTSGSRGWAEYYSESGPKFIRAQNIRFGKLRLNDLASVNPPKKSEGMRTQASKGNLLVVITGAGVTNPALLDTDLGDAYVSQHVALIKPTDTNLSPWLLLCLMAPMGGRAELVSRAYGAGKPGLNLDNIRSLPIPLPPLAEQYRIVAKVDQLMAVCDRAEKLLITAQSGASRLLEAVLHHALSDDSPPQELVRTAALS
jgi:type I restriction enzyme, S subunit